MYLQKDNELKHRQDIPKETVVRSHQMNIQEYKIQPLDVLYITFESLTDDKFDFFSKSSPQEGMAGGGGTNLQLMGVMVDTEGNIEYPEVGKVKVSGLSVFEAQDKLQSIAGEYIRDAVVRIRLLNFRFTVLGEVNGETVVTSPNTRVTMMEAVGMAGGFTELADRSMVKVIRQNGPVSDVFYVDLLDEDYVESEKYYIQQNDIIIVPPLRQRTFKKYFTQNLSIITTTVSAIFIFLSLTQ